MTETKEKSGAASPNINNYGSHENMYSKNSDGRLPEI